MIWQFCTTLFKEFHNGKFGVQFELVPMVQVNIFVWINNARNRYGKFVFYLKEN
jgi:hypothetical protein